MEQNRILVVDDDEKILFAFREVLEKDGHEFLQARNGEEALEKLKIEQPDIIFMDVSMPKVDGLQVLQEIRKTDYSKPVIIITGQGTIQTAVKAMQLGAFQYLIKPLSVKTIREEIRKAQINLGSGLTPESQYNISPSDRYQLIGNSNSMHQIYKIIGSLSIAPNHTSVLIQGESGTGKELVARAIHNNGAHCQQPFIAINCTAVPETLLESELFGHEKGAFTGAIECKIGKFELAGKGTIFLDEIGDLSPNLQHKLLRVLQEREFERVGGNSRIMVEARFIAATNQNLEKKVKNGSFRKDLYFRLKVVTIHIPPLREHKEDILLLANFFLSRYKNQIKKNIDGFTDDAMAKLKLYNYPGNIRELENIIERAVILIRGRFIDREILGDLPVTLETTQVSLPIVSPVYSESRDYLLGLFEKQFILEQLEKHQGNVSAAAKASRMSRQNFHRLIQKYNIKFSY